MPHHENGNRKNVYCTSGPLDPAKLIFTSDSISICTLETANRGKNRHNHLESPN